MATRPTSFNQNDTGIDLVAKLRDEDGQLS